MPTDLAAHAREFDGAWPYLSAIADAAGQPIRSTRRWCAATGSAGRCSTGRPDRRCWPGCGMRSAGRSPACSPSFARQTALANHSFHVFVVYPWVRFLDRDPTHAGEGHAGLPDSLGHRRFRA